MCCNLFETPSAGLGQPAPDPLLRLPASGHLWRRRRCCSLSRSLPRYPSPSRSQPASRSPASEANLLMPTQLALRKWNVPEDSSPLAGRLPAANLLSSRSSPVIIIDRPATCCRPRMVSLLQPPTSSSKPQLDSRTKLGRDSSPGGQINSRIMFRRHDHLLPAAALRPPISSYRRPLLASTRQVARRAGWCWLLLLLPLLLLEPLVGREKRLRRPLVGSPGETTSSKLKLKLGGDSPSESWSPGEGTVHLSPCGSLVEPLLWTRDSRRATGVPLEKKRKLITPQVAWRPADCLSVRRPAI